MEVLLIPGTGLQELGDTSTFALITLPFTLRVYFESLPAVSTDNDQPNNICNKGVFVQYLE